MYAYSVQSQPLVGNVKLSLSVEIYCVRVFIQPLLSTNDFRQENLA